MAFCVLPGWANNLQVTNTAVIPQMPPDGTARIQFDIAWENSWRYDQEPGDAYFHDAAWVFFKVRPEGGDWQHVVLHGSGTNPAGFAAGTADDSIELLVPEDRIGLFVRRSADGIGSGTLVSSNVTVRWNIFDSGIALSQSVDVRTYGIEMVYVAEGAFWAGDGLTGQGQFVQTLIHTNDPTVTAVWDAALLEGDGAYTGGRPHDQTVPSTNAWPNGFNAFYCMKYSITQGQYADFLRSLTSDQTALRYFVTSGSRYTLSGAWPNIVAARPDRACNNLSWADGAAFADWAGLRPMTELEYEKACRGPLLPVPGEFAWGTDTIRPAGSLTLSGAEDGTETVTSAMSAGGALYGGAAISGGDGGSGPVRVGIFATNNADRVSAGASYWGIMELSGNLYERPVTIGHATGRAFAGSHGDGVLTSAGDANVGDWPGTDAAGTGIQGGNWHHSDVNVSRVSDRQYATSVQSTRMIHTGFRAVRSAP